MREVYYADDIGNYLFKDSKCNLFPSKVALVQAYNSSADVLKMSRKTYYIGEGE